MAKWHNPDRHFLQCRWLSSFGVQTRNKLGLEALLSVHCRHDLQKEDVLGCSCQVRTQPLTSSICNNAVFGVKILRAVLWEVKAEFALWKQQFNFTLIYIHNDGEQFP